MKSILLATRNTDKVRELADLLKSLPASLVTPQDLGLTLQIAEDGTTYAENAAQKALAFAHASGILTLADDTGLEVVALDGYPGIYSARIAPTDEERRQKLLNHLRDSPRPWKALFRCVVALALPSGVIHFSQGICYGEIIPQPRGDQGFGYDPIFWLPTQGRTLAELSLTEKNHLSHRALAIQAALPIIRDHLRLP